jgi:hypothetical protein
MDSNIKIGSLVCSICDLYGDSIVPEYRVLAIGQRPGEVIVARIKRDGSQGAPTAAYASTLVAVSR